MSDKEILSLSQAKKEILLLSQEFSKDRLANGQYIQTILEKLANRIRDVEK